MTKDFGVNAGLVSELLGMYLHDRSSVDEQWRSYLDALIGGGDPGAPQLRAPAAPAPAAPSRARTPETIAPMSTRTAASLQDATLTAGVTQLIAAYRARG